MYGSSLTVCPAATNTAELPEPHFTLIPESETETWAYPGSEFGESEQPLPVAAAPDADAPKKTKALPSEGRYLIPPHCLQQLLLLKPLSAVSFIRSLTVCLCPFRVYRAGKRTITV
jgi:hypothetical protein